MIISRREVLVSTIAASLVALVGVSGPYASSAHSESSKYPELITLNGDENSLLQLSRMLLGGY